MTQPVHQEVQYEEATGAPGLRLFQILVAATGAVMFVIGLLAVFQVDFDGEMFFDTTGEVGGFGFSAAFAIAAVVLGAGILLASLASQDRTGAGIMALVAIIVGIAALVIDDQPDVEVSVDRGAAAVFIVLGAIAFVLSLVPWWSGRRRHVDVLR